MSKRQRIKKLVELIRKWEKINCSQSKYIISCYKKELKKLKMSDKKYYDNYKSSFNCY